MLVHWRLPAIQRLSHRTLASSVLLRKSWEAETVVDLRMEAKSRGLSTKGTKALLISRIREHEERLTLSAISSPQSSASQGVREASTDALAAAPTASAESPGIPPQAQRSAPVHHLDFLNLSLPNLSAPEPEEPVQIPYVPDFWDSSKRVEPQPDLDDIPAKMLVVGGAATHHGGGPSHNIHTDHDSEGHDIPEHSEAALQQSQGGILSDIVEDVGLAPLLSSEKARQVQKALVDALPDSIGTPQAEQSSRALDKDEVRGVWVLLGLLAGGWLAGGFFTKKPSPKLVEEEQAVAGH